MSEINSIDTKYWLLMFLGGIQTYNYETCRIEFWFPHPTNPLKKVRMGSVCMNAAAEQPELVDYFREKLLRKMEIIE